MWFRAKLKRSVWEGENQLYSRRRHRKLLHKKDSLRILLVSVTVMILLMVLTTQPIRLFNAYLSIPANIEPLIVEYRQTDLHSALQQSIMGHHNVLCADVAERQTNSREVLPIPPKFPVRMSFRMHCEDLFVNNIYGTGNVLLMLYNIRLIARLLGNVSIQMECVDAMETRSSLVIPWIMGSFPANVWPGPSASLEDACDSFQPKTAHIIVDDIQYELRRMAISLVGVPSINHPAANFTVKESKERTLQVPMTTAPLRSDVELDDVVIHFRCGDIIELKAHHKYHYVRWSVLAKRISPAARTIGIVTQPSQGQTRKIDNHNRDRCTQLLGPMQTYLQQRLPWAQVRIRNAPEETIALAFSRFIMANQSLAGGFSTFYRMPFYATFGTAYDYDEMGDNHMVSSELMMDLWQNETGLQRILSLLPVMKIENMLISIKWIASPCNNHNETNPSFARIGRCSIMQQVESNIRKEPGISCRFPNIDYSLEVRPASVKNNCLGIASQPPSSSKLALFAGRTTVDLSCTILDQWMSSCFR